MLSEAPDSESVASARSVPVTMAKTLSSVRLDASLRRGVCPARHARAPRTRCRRLGRHARCQASAASSTPPTKNASPTAATSSRDRRVHHPKPAVAPHTHKEGQSRDEGTSSATKPACRPGEKTQSGDGSCRPHGRARCNIRGAGLSRRREEHKGHEMVVPKRLRVLRVFRGFVMSRG